MKSFAQTWVIWALNLAVAAGLAFAPAGQPPQQADKTRYFPETGHSVSGPFLVYFDARGGLEAFGFPITGEYIDPVSGLRVQYFQRARFEYHPDNPEAYLVELGLLGTQYLDLREPRTPTEASPVDNNPGCEFFAETGHNVCFSFLNFYRAQGGLDIFGFPVTESLYENGRFVQYFQRARMEWHPESPAGEKVQLSYLGVLYFDLAGLDQSLRPTDSATPRQITSLTVHASVDDPTAGQGDLQTVYVYVVDQQSQPVSDAQVRVIAHLPDGDQAFQLPATNENGTTTVTFGLGQATPGTMILLEVSAASGFVAGDTRTSFLPWW